MILLRILFHLRNGSSGRIRIEYARGRCRCTRGSIPNHQLDALAGILLQSGARHAILGVAENRAIHMLGVHDPATAQRIRNVLSS